MTDHKNRDMRKIAKALKGKAIRIEGTDGEIVQAVMDRYEGFARRLYIRQQGEVFAIPQHLIKRVWYLLSDQSKMNAKPTWTLVFGPDEERKQVEQTEKAEHENANRPAADAHDA